MNSLDGNLSLELETGQVWLKRKVIVQRLDIRRQNLSALRDIHGAGGISARIAVEVFAHAALVATVS
jgi:hypothetical protein